MVKAALFDIDGTLVDTVDLHAAAWREAFAHFGKQVDYDEVRSQIGKGGDKLIPTFLEEDEVDRFGAEVEEYRSQLYKREYLPLAKPFPGARDLVRRVHAAGIRVALASSCKKDELQHYIDLVDIEAALDAAVTADDIEESKPAPDVFEAALDRLAADARDSVAVGDSPFDAIAAGRAGVRTIGLLCGGFPRTTLLEAGCIALYEGPEDLLLRFDASPFVDGAAAGLETSAQP